VVNEMGCKALFPDRPCKKNVRINQDPSHLRFQVMAAPGGAFAVGWAKEKRPRLLDLSRSSLN
jgi:hypothetical protein